MKQLKIGDDLVIYEMDYVNQQHLHEICDLHQPVSFSFYEYIPSSLFYNDTNEQYDIHVIDTNDYYTSEDSSDIVPISLSMKHVKKLMNSNNDNVQQYISEQNEDYLVKTGLIEKCKLFDVYLKPLYTIQTMYDYWYGENNATTIAKYHTHYRQFLYVVSGTIRLKMTSWNYTQYLHPCYDSFCSPLHFFIPQEKYKIENEHIHFIEFELHTGYALFIPPYWWYSIQYMEESSNVCMLTYNTLLNKIINVPQIIKSSFSFLTKERKKKEEKEEKEKKEKEEKEGEEGGLYVITS